MAQLERHDRYYSSDEFIVLKVEHTLYRILKSILTTQSEFFKEMFSPDFPNPPSTDQRNAEGTSDSNPIVFEQVLQVDFDRLLGMICNGSIDRSVSRNWNVPEWIPILDLAARWRMPEVKQLALNSVQSVAEPRIKIGLGKKYDDKTLIRSGLVDFCCRTEFVTEQEALEIGYDIALKCAQVREKIWVSYETAGWDKDSRARYVGNTFSYFAREYGIDYVEEAFTGSLL